MLQSSGELPKTTEARQALVCRVGPGPGSGQPGRQAGHLHLCGADTQQLSKAGCRGGRDLQVRSAEADPGLKIANPLQPVSNQSSQVNLWLTRPGKASGPKSLQTSGDPARPP